MVFYCDLNGTHINICFKFTAENADGPYSLYILEAIKGNHREVVEFAFNFYARYPLSDWPLQLVPRISDWPMVLRASVLQALKLDHFYKLYDLCIINANDSCGAITHCQVTLTEKSTGEKTVFSYDNNGEFDGHYPYQYNGTATSIARDLVKQHWDYVTLKKESRC